MEIENKRRIMSVQLYAGSLLQSLLGMGLTEQDIREFYLILLSGGFDFDVNAASNNIIINKKLLIEELTKYRNIKLVTRELELNNKKIAKTITDLESQKTILENYINLLLGIMYNLVDLKSLLKKVNIALEYPKILVLICIASDSNKEDSDKDFKDNNAE
jgi:hypothetical protein